MPQESGTIVLLIKRANFPKKINVFPSQNAPIA